MRASARPPRDQPSPRPSPQTRRHITLELAVVTGRADADRLAAQAPLQATSGHRRRGGRDGPARRRSRLADQARPVSNGEFLPQPLGPTVIEALRLAREQCDRAARRLRIDRREFLKSATASAITLFFLDRMSARASAGSVGGQDHIPRDALWEPEAARARLEGREFIMDVQGHLLEYDLNPATRGRRLWGDQFRRSTAATTTPGRASR